MKTIFALLLAFSAVSLSAQSVKTGKWMMPDGSIVHRPNDTTQIETFGGQIDTLQIKWKGEKAYQIVRSGLWVRIDCKGKGSYKGLVTDGEMKKYFEAKNIE